MDVCRFTGDELNCDCPLENHRVNPMEKLNDPPIDFENNSYWNAKSARNLQNMETYSDRGLRRINGALRINGDLLVEGDIIGRQGASFSDEIMDNTGFSITDLQAKNSILNSRLDIAERMIKYFCQRFAVNADDIDKETEKLTKRHDVDKRLDAIG